MPVSGGLVFLLCAASVPAAVSCALMSVLYAPPQEAALWILTAKLSHLPVHLILLFPLAQADAWEDAGTAFLSLSAAMLWLTGIAGTGIWLRERLDRRIRARTAMALSSMGFFYVLDLIAAAWGAFRAGRPRIRETARPVDGPEAPDDPDPDDRTDS